MWSAMNAGAAAVVTSKQTSVHRDSFTRLPRCPLKNAGSATECFKVQSTKTIYCMGILIHRMATIHMANSAAMQLILSLF